MHIYSLFLPLAGEAGFEPANGGIKSRCLTAWPLPNISERILFY
tara:strand:- start:4205 stop:4336 length:132 start_codon:yes stop_codon:yes gene_type:complete